MAMRIFVTGATGFVGRNFLTWLLAHQPDVEITCLARDPKKAKAQWPQQPSNLHWLHGDLLEPATYQAAVVQADRVFHLAALVSLKNGPDFYRMNTDATHCLVNALSGSKLLQRLVFLGSISAVDRPLDQPAIGPLTEESVPHPNTDYGKSKLQAGECIIRSGLPYTILRPPYIFGPHARRNSSIDRLVRDMLAGATYLRFPFPGRASVITVDDLSEMLWLAGWHPKAKNETFFVANPSSPRITDAFAQLAQALEVPFEPLQLSPEQIERYQRRWAAAHPNHLVLRILFEDFFYCSVDKWVRLTGHQPQAGYQAGLERMIGWYRAQERLHTNTIS
jgi:nucleoside-diphosphate-sugar epimerase